MHAILDNLKIKKAPVERLKIIIPNSQSRGAYFSVNVLILTNDGLRWAGEALTHWGSWLTQALLLNLAPGGRRQSEIAESPFILSRGGPDSYSVVIVIQPSQI